MNNEDKNRDKQEMIEIIDELSPADMALLHGFMLGLRAKENAA